MSHIESPVETLTRFAQTPGWLDESLSVLTSDLLTSHSESNLEWDSFFYEERNGVIFDPVRERPIVGTDGGDTAQKRVNEELQEWFLKHDSGIAVRISPRGGRWKYPEEQLAIYRISYKFGSKQKVLLCASHQFNADLKNPEEIRQFIFTEEDKEEAVFEIIKWLIKTSQKKVETAVHKVQEKRQQAFYYATLLKSGMDPREVFQQMNQSGFLGQNPIGCAPVDNTQSFSYSEIITQTLSYDTEGWHNGTCRVCHASTWVGPCSICKPCESKI